MKNIPLIFLYFKVLNFAITMQEESGRKLKILMILKDHMRDHTRSHMAQFEKHNVRICFVSNKLADDSVMLSAALVSGYDCSFVSDDHLRGYTDQLRKSAGKVAAELFLKYQQSNQMRFNSQEKETMPMTEVNFSFLVIFLNGLTTRVK